MSFCFRAFIFSELNRKCSLVKYSFALFICATILAGEPEPFFPPGLEKNDLIAVVFPASFLQQRTRGQEIVNEKVAWLQKQGYRTICYPKKVSPIGYLAGTDTERAKALMDAWKNKEVKAIWCFRGGYGTCRILDLLDYEWIKTHPKILLGMSDITALHQAIQQKTGLVTFLAPTLNHFSQNDSGLDSDYSLSEFQKVVVNGKNEHIQPPKAGYEIEIISPGKAKGKLVGGNLSIVASLCGTRWQIDTKGKILVLEDVSEEIYRIDRMLWQIKEAGLLDSPAGVVLGTWINCKKSTLNSLSLHEVFNHYFEGAHYPVMMGFPTGHTRWQATIPLNVEAEISTYKKSIKLLEPAIQKSSSLKK